MERLVDILDIGIANFLLGMGQKKDTIASIEKEKLIPTKFFLERK